MLKNSEKNKFCSDEVCEIQISVTRKNFLPVHNLSILESHIAKKK